MPKSNRFVWRQVKILFEIGEESSGKTSLKQGDFLDLIVKTYLWYFYSIYDLQINELLSRKCFFIRETFRLGLGACEHFIHGLSLIAGEI